MEEYTSEVTLLRKYFKATPTEGLEVKRVKLADCLTAHYLSTVQSPQQRS